jgi:hypothetical protein
MIFYVRISTDVPHWVMYMWLTVCVHGGDEKCTQSLGQITWKEETFGKDNIRTDHVDVGCEIVS